MQAALEPAHGNPRAIARLAGRITLPPRILAFRPGRGDLLVSDIEAALGKLHRGVSIG